MQVVLWNNFSKKHNSTRIPTTQGALFDMVMKHETSLNNPTFFINSNDFSFTYAYWNGTYYFVNDIISVRDSYIAISCTKDVLATHREAILNTTQLVARSASDYDGKIIDKMAVGKADIKKNEVTFNSPFETTGTYVLGVIAKNRGSATIGCVTYYALSSSKLAELMRFMLGDIDYMGIDFDSLADWTEQLFKGLINPFQYIVSCTYFPFEVPFGASSFIEFGFWETTISANYLGASIVSFSAYADIPKHNQAGSRGSYLNLAPYTNYVLNYSPFGNVPIDTHSLINSSSLSLLTVVDLLTGKGLLKVSDNNGIDIMTLHSQIGVPVQMAQLVKGIIGGDVASVAVSSITSSAISAYTSLSIESMNVGSSTSSFAPKLMTSGGNGSRAEYTAQSRNIVAEFIQVAEENRALNGRPLMQNRVLRDISGYTECINPSIDIECLESDRGIINSYLSSGLYIE